MKQIGFILILASILLSFTFAGGSKKGHIIDNMGNRIQGTFGTITAKKVEFYHSDNPKKKVKYDAKDIQGFVIEDEGEEPLVFESVKFTSMADPFALSGNIFISVYKKGEKLGLYYLTTGQPEGEWAVKRFGTDENPISMSGKTLMWKKKGSEFFNGCPAVAKKIENGELGYKVEDLVKIYTEYENCGK